MMEKYNINQTTLKVVGLYTTDYEVSLHLREIARQTKVDVKAVQLQLKRLETTNILASIPKGRNKEYSLRLDDPIAKYYVMMAEAFATVICLANNFVIKKVVSEIVSKIEGTVVLFGSFARGDARKNSDIDLFVISDEGLQARTKNMVDDASDLIGRKISLKTANPEQFSQGLDDADPLIREVVSNHVVLRGIDEFCEIMWSHHARP
jgi:predicted nucleotidyltransferase